MNDSKLRPALRPAYQAPLAALCLAACPLGPVAVDPDGPPSTSSTVATADATTTAITSGPDTSGAVPEPTTNPLSSTTGDGGESTLGGDDSTTGTSTTTATATSSTTSSITASTTAVDATTADIDSTGGSTTAPLDTCGDGVLDPGELCDDGNEDPGDGCLPDCTPGTGVALGPLDLPAPDPSGYRTCLTLLDGAMPRLEDGLVLGGPLYDFGPDGQGAAHVERFPLPAAHPVMWSWADHAGPNDRYINQLVTTDSGDILAAGTVYTDPDALGGFLWLARFTPEGELVWLRDHASIPSRPNDLASSPAGDVLVAAQFAGWANDAEGAWVHAFDADGSFLWEHAAPTAAEWRLLYTGITVDDDGTIYATGRGGSVDPSFDHPVLQSFSAGGVLLWQTEHPAPKYAHAVPSGITITTEGALVIAITQGATPWSHDQTALAAFATTGAPLWWRDLPPIDPWVSSAGPILTAPNGGVFVAWSDGDNEDSSHGRITRHGASGELLWSIDPAGDTPRDAAVGPDGLLYVLQGDEVHRYDP